MRLTRCIPSVPGQPFHYRQGRATLTAWAPEKGLCQPMMDPEKMGR